MQQGGGDLFQLPVIGLEARALGETGRFQATLLVEAVAGHAVQHAIGLHRVDVDVLAPLAMPQTALGTLRIAAALGQGAAALGDVLGPGRDVLANQDAGQHQH